MSMPLNRDSQTGVITEYEYSGGGPRNTGRTSLNTSSLQTDWAKGQSISPSRGYSFTGSGARGSGGIAGINTPGGALPLFAGLVAQGRYSVGWNRGRMSVADFLGVGRQATDEGAKERKYSSIDAMKQRLQGIIDSAPKEMSQAGFIYNPRDRRRAEIGVLSAQAAPYEKYFALKKKKSLYPWESEEMKRIQKQLGGQGKEVMKNGKLVTVQKSYGQKLADIRAKMKAYPGPSYEGYAGFHKANQEAARYKSFEKKQMDALKGWTPTTSNVPIKETLIPKPIKL